MKISIKNIFNLILYVLISLVFFLGISKTDSSNYRVVSIIIMFQLIFNLFSLKSNRIKIVSPFGIFIILLYLFNFGQILLKGLAPNYSFVFFNIFNNVENELLYKAIIYNFVIINMLVIGALISNVFNKSASRENNILHVKYYQYCKPISIFLLAVSIPAMIYIDMSSLYVTFLGGYSSRLSFNIPGFLRNIAGLFMPGLILLIFHYKDKKKQTRFIMFITLLYKFLVMLGGQRGDSIIFIIVIIFVYYKMIEKIKLVELLKLSLLALFILSLITFIKETRGVGNKSIASLLPMFFNSISNKLVFKNIEELGGTLLTTTLVLGNYPLNLNFLYGGSYYISFFTVLPNIGGVIGRLMDNFRWAQHLSTILGGIGGSFTGELYVNFGIFSYFFAVVFGGALLKLSNLFMRKMRESDYLFISVFAITFSYILLWVRGTFETLVRNTVWTAIIVYGFYNVIKRKTNPLNTINNLEVNKIENNI